MKNHFNLQIDPQNWSSGLIASLSALRQSWRQDWIGLVAVLGACQQVLGLQDHGKSNDLQALRIRTLNRYAVQIAQCMDQPDTPQPAYHNSLHTADVLVSLTTLIKIQIQNSMDVDKLWVAGLLAAAIGHDFAHPGGVNQYPSEIESNSVRSLKAHVDDSELDPIDLERVEQLILSTDVRVVPANHREVSSTDFFWGLPWSSVLLNEADILASTTMEFGPASCLSLSTEWAAAGVQDSHAVATHRGWLQFLKSTQFSSPSSIALGLPDQVQRLIDSH